MIETYFNIRYEFEKSQVISKINQRITEPGSDYVCVVDGNITANVHSSPSYSKIINDGLFSISDGSWTPIFLKLIHGIKREPYTGSQIFEDIINLKKYRIAFLGGTTEALDGLSKYLEKKSYPKEKVLFLELPFKNVEKFEYKEIAKSINRISADIIWVGLGAPKQEIFMSLLKPHLPKGVMIGVGAVFNFYGSSNIERAPNLIRSLHLEFLYRLFSEPQKQVPKFKNYIITIPKILLKEYKTKKQRKNGRFH